MIRVSTLDEANKVIQFLDGMLRLHQKSQIVHIQNIGYLSHALEFQIVLSNLVFESLKQVGPPKWGRCKEICNEIRKNLGLQKSRTILKRTSEIINPQEADLIIKKIYHHLK